MAPSHTNPSARQARRDFWAGRAGATAAIGAGILIAGGIAAGGNAVSDAAARADVREERAELRPVARASAIAIAPLADDYARTYAASRRQVRDLCGPLGLQRWQVRRDLTATQVQQAIADASTVMTTAARTGTLPDGPALRRLRGASPSAASLELGGTSSYEARALTTKLAEHVRAEKREIRHDAARFVRTSVCAIAATERR
jgi:hypothetical protein